MDGSVLSGAGKVIWGGGGGLLALKRVPARSDTLGGDFAELPLVFRKRGFPTLLGCMYHVTGTTRNW